MLRPHIAHNVRLFTKCPKGIWAERPKGANRKKPVMRPIRVEEPAGDEKFKTRPASVGRPCCCPNSVKN